MKRCIAICLVLLAVVAPPVRAQDPPAAAGQAAASDAKNVATRAEVIKEMVQAGEAAGKANIPGGRPFQTTFGSGGRELVAAFLMTTHTERAGYRTLLDTLETRVDKQVGAAPSKSGGTSLVMKGLVPDILGVAVENGALTEEVKGTVLTFRATPAGIVKALQGQELLDIYNDYRNSTGLRYASRFSAAASFDAARGSSATTFSGEASELTSWSVRYAVINHRDPASKAYGELWAALLRDKPYQDSKKAIETALSHWTEFTQWETDLTAKVETEVDAPLRADKNVPAAGGRFKAILEAALPALQKLPNQPKAVTDALDQYVAQLARVQKDIASIYEFVGKGLLVTFDWSTAREKDVPDLYTTTAIIEASLGASRKTDFSANVVANCACAAPASTTHAFKRFDAAAQLEHPLASSFVLPSATLSLASEVFVSAQRYRSRRNARVNGREGSIIVVQGKVTVPIKGSGMKILSITASNRTELIKEKDVRANVGVTFDLDTFLAALSGKAR